MKTKIIKIDDILIDKETYPRINTDFVTIARYYNAMRSGAVFPVIVVGLLDKKYYLIDGKHRLTAWKQLKETHLQCEVIPLKNKKELYLEAVKRNMNHGRQFSTQEVTNIVITLGEWNLSKEQISEIVRLPANELSRFVAKRMVRITNSQGDSEDIALRSNLKNLAGSNQMVEFEEAQNHIVGSRSQEFLLDSVISLIQNNWIDLSDKEVIKKLNIIALLINNLGIKPESK